MSFWCVVVVVVVGQIREKQLNSETYVFNEWMKIRRQLVNDCHLFVCVRVDICEIALFIKTRKVTDN